MANIKTNIKSKPKITTPYFSHLRGRFSKKKKTFFNGHLRPRENRFLKFQLSRSS